MMDSTSIVYSEQYKIEKFEYIPKKRRKEV